MSAINDTNSSNQLFTAFGQDCASADANFALIANKMPKDKIVSYKMDSNGNFALGYATERKGVASNSNDPQLQALLEGTTLKTSKVVKGTIDKTNRTIRFASGSLVLTAKAMGMAVDLNVTQARAQGDKLELTASKTLFWKEISATQTVGLEQIMGTRVVWDKD